MKTGLIMEGGAMRGMFTCGVMDVLLREEIEFDGAIGVSAGAVFGCNYKSRQIDRAIRYNTRFCKDKRYCSFRSLIRTGDLYGADFCYNKLPYELDIFDTDTFEKNPMEFWVVATDVHTGKAYYHKCKTGKGEDMKWFRASASMPVLSRPVEIRGGSYLDGGCADSVPLTFFESIGYDRNLVVLTQPKGYRKKSKKMSSLTRVALKKYPAILKDLETRAEDYNSQMEEVEKAAKDGKILAIYPPEALNIGAAEKKQEELLRVYRIGEETAKEKLPGIKEFLKTGRRL